ncbi:hypothetical protein B9G55_04250 [Saccharibacillus sp. O16]|nr:hypothetical protein B9G55_04250 [Saccharibacillus sp. O16]
MFKKVKLAALLLLALPVCPLPGHAAAPPQLVANSNSYPASSYVIKEGRVYCKIETLSSMMGALNSWVFKERQSASFITHFSAKGDSDEFYTWFAHSDKVEIRSVIDGKENVKNLSMDHQTIVSQDGELFIPLRDAVQALGKTITWDRKSNRIVVTGKIAY